MIITLYEIIIPLINNQEREDEWLNAAIAAIDMLKKSLSAKQSAIDAKQNRQEAAAKQVIAVKDKSQIEIDRQLPSHQCDEIGSLLLILFF